MQRASLSASPWRSGSGDDGADPVVAETLLIIALGVIAVAAVAYPVIVGRARFADAATLDAEVERYREAVAAGTVCSRCRFANPEGSRFCAECGQRLDQEG